MASNPSQLPLEIIDNILSFIPSPPVRPDYGHPEALLACSLVCRSWLHISWKYLFESLDLNAGIVRRNLKLVKSTDVFSEIRPESTLPMFLGHVRRLCVPVCQSDSDINEIWAKRDRALFPRVYMLHMASYSGKGPTPKYLSVLSTNLTTITDLSLVAVSCPEVTTVIQFLSSFPHLTRLSLGDNVHAYPDTSVKPETELPTRPRSCLRVRSLFRRTDDMIIQWLAKQFCTDLTSLDLECNWLPIYLHLKTFLLQASSTVKCLNLPVTQLRMLDGLNAILPSLDFPELECIHLKDLSFGPAAGELDNPLRQEYVERALEQLLSNFAAPKLTLVYILVTGEPSRGVSQYLSANPTMIYWDNVDEILAGNRFPLLKTIVMPILDRYQELPTDEASMRQSFRRCLAKGIQLKLPFKQNDCQGHVSDWYTEG